MQIIKKILFTLIFLTTTFVLYAQKMSFYYTQYNLGLIKESDGDVYYDFIFSNIGTQPLLIKKVITGCGCTTSEWKTQPYPAKSKGKIRVIFHPSNRRSESINIPIEVSTNAGTYTLTLTGKVKLDKIKTYNHFNLNEGKKADYISYKISDDYEEILERIKAQLFQSNSIKIAVNNAISYTKQLSSEGKWLQFDYECLYGPSWEPINHLTRIKQLVIAFVNKDSELYGNEVLYMAIIKTLQMWHKIKPISSNWWYNDIAVPQVLGDILLLMENAPTKLNTSLREILIQAMNRSNPKKWTGANKMDIAMHHLVRGCLLKNDSIVKTNAEEFFQPICITDKEGIREDLSFQQHNKQLYIGGYGTVFVDNILKIAPLLQGTDFSLNNNQTELFSKFVRKTYLNVFRRQYMDFSVCGRSVSRKNALRIGNWSSFFRNMKSIDKKNATEYDSIIKRFNNKISFAKGVNLNQLFYTSDYMLHKRKNYDFSVRAVSNRTCRSESGNGENLLGTYLSEGATNIRIKGDEYYNIFPVWEWDKIPGTTTPEGEIINKNEWGIYGIADFVGGVSDGLYGVMAYAMNDYGMKANKGWFMFDDEIVCLGAGITSELNKNINTTINQCHLVGNIYTFDGNDLNEIENNQLIREKRKGWIWHNNIGYYFPKEVNLCLKNKKQTGKWSKINNNLSTNTISLPTFNLWINHGKSPKNNSYAYILVPNIENPSSLEKYDLKNIEIKHNSTDLQVVVHRELDILQAIFYTSGDFKYDNKIIVAEKPCVIMIKNISREKPDILIADPTQKNILKVGKDLKINTQ